MIETLIYVAAGSAIGGVSRYLLGKVINEHYTSHIFLGTMVVNIIGCFAIGLFYGLANRHDLLSNNMKMFLITGFCGSFTTFSTFTNESYILLKNGDLTTFVTYLLISLIGGITALIIGNEAVKLFQSL